MCRHYYYNILFIVFFAFIAVSCGDLSNDDVNELYVLQDADTHLKYDSEYIVVIGDIQEYTFKPEFTPYYAATMEWIWSQIKHGYKINCVLQTGDITWHNFPNEYQVFYKYTQPVAELVPYISCPGNHDYSNNENNLIVDRYNTLFSDYTDFELVSSLIVDRFEPNRMENIIVENTIGNSRFDIISLEFGPRETVIDWVNRHVKINPNRKYLLMTHEYLTASGARIGSNAYSDTIIEDNSATNPEELWMNLVSCNNNIIGVLCGHNGFYTKLLSVNEFGREVPQILFNLQYQENGGDGWIQIWEFPIGKDYVNVDIYNSITRQYHPDKPRFQFKY